MEPTQKKKTAWWKIILGVFVGLLIIGMLLPDDSKKEGASTNSAPAEAAAVAGIGDVLHTQYFDIVVNNVAVEDKVRTGNQYSDLPAEEGNRYVIINASFKNTDNESRMLVEGSLFIDYNGKQYEFDKSEMVMAEGWGLFLDQINPLTTKTTKLVYKIPAEITGTILWNPGRSTSGEVINLGTL